MLVKDVLVHLDSHGKAGLKPIPFRGVDTARAHIGPFVFGPHFLLVSTNRGMSAQEVEKPCHTCDGNTLKVFDGYFGRVQG